MNVGDAVPPHVEEALGGQPSGAVLLAYWLGFVQGMRVAAADLRLEVERLDGQLYRGRDE